METSNLGNIYTIDFFINKFEVIPEEMWCVDELQNERGQRCAIGHCEAQSLVDYTESNTLIRLSKYRIASVNNGIERDYQQPTPKQRVLAFLYNIKADQAVKEAKKIIGEIVKKDLDIRIYYKN